MPTSIVFVLLSVATQIIRKSKEQRSEKGPTTLGASLWLFVRPQCVVISVVDRSMGTQYI